MVKDSRSAKRTAVPGKEKKELNVEDMIAVAELP